MRRTTVFTDHLFNQGCHISFNGLLGQVLMIFLIAPQKHALWVLVGIAEVISVSTQNIFMEK